jgi:hypothetical protein
MPEDTYWYEAAFVAGITNALNVTADGLAPSGVAPLLSTVAPDHASSKVLSLFNDIKQFYNVPEVPVVFQILAQDPIYLTEFWEAMQHAFSDNQLSRRIKESLAFAVSLTARSTFGATLHLSQMRRFGVTDKGVMEIIGVTQMFSSYTKIADTLQLTPDMGEIAPVDPTPAPSQ